MSYPKIAQLVNLLSKNTIAGTIIWEETNKTGVFQTSFPDYTVCLFPRQNRNSEDDDIIIQVINSNGELVEEVSDVDLRSHLEDSYPLMKSMYEVARRQVMGVEQAIDSILKELHDPDEGFDNDIPF